MSIENEHTNARNAENSNDFNDKDREQTSTTECTLEEYANVKHLPIGYLKELIMTDAKYQGKKAVRIPYLDQTHREIAVRFRIAIKGKSKFRWKTGSKTLLYGLWKLKNPLFVILVEGESDCQTLWYHGFPALGLPGAGTWNEEWAEHLEKIETIYVFIEQDQGGKAILRWLENSSINKRVKLVTISDFKDVSELHLADQTKFKAVFQQALDSSIPWVQHKQKETAVLKKQLWDDCKNLARKDNILEFFGTLLKESGYIGDINPAKLLYLTLTSRFLDRPVSASIKGPSSGGKSFLVDTVLKFFPPSAFYALSGQSEKALIYSNESLAHRILIIFEAVGLGGDFAQYMIRTLLSEGCIKYEVTEKIDDTFETRLIEKEGPTGLILTTTAINVHRENETRILSIQIDDTPEQTKDILRMIASQTNQKDEFDFSIWHALQEYFIYAEHRVFIPYAEILALLIPPVALRLRRDFTHVLHLIKSHAILHQETRAKDRAGRIVATLDDYRVVAELISGLLSENLGHSVSDTLRTTVNAVKALSESYSSCTPPIKISQIAKHLQLDQSTVRRRVYAALEKGYLENVASPHKMMLLQLGDALPESSEILPSIETLAAHVHECNNFWGTSVILPFNKELENEPIQ